MPQTATFKSLPAAFAMMKAMQAEDVEWGEDYRVAGSQALAELLACSCSMAWCSSARPAPGALARPVLVALGLRPGGKKEVIDFRLASAESAPQWGQFLGDLVRCGLVGARLEMLCVDGGAGLLAAAHRLSGGAGAGCWRTRSATC